MVKSLCLLSMMLSPYQILLDMLNVQVIMHKVNRLQVALAQLVIALLC